MKFKDQCRELTTLRKECPEYGELNAQSCQVTLKRVDLAFQHFFRRVRQGASQVGFPRFKSKNRFKGFGYKSHGDGFRVLSEGKHGAVRISGVGQVRIRGKARTWGQVKTAELLRKNEYWYLSVTVDCEPKRKCGNNATAFDWGVEKYATLVSSNGIYQEVENPRFLKKALKKLKKAQKDLSRKKLRSQNREKSRKHYAKCALTIAHQRKNFAHQLSHQMISKNALLATEELEVKAMTQAGGNYKKGLNREILNTAPAMFISFLKYKAEEAGTKWIEIPTRKVKPSQTCSGCGNKEKKKLSERIHECEICGLKLGRDQNSARVILNWALVGNATGRGSSSWGEAALAASVSQETPSITT